jgi:lipopolysaccharide assembly outer membrane protein LptD (OstA)
LSKLEKARFILRTRRRAFRHGKLILSVLGLFWSLAVAAQTPAQAPIRREPDKGNLPVPGQPAQRVPDVRPNANPNQPANTGINSASGTTPPASTSARTGRGGATPGRTTSGISTTASVGGADSVRRDTTDASFKTTVRYASRDSSYFENATQTLELFGDAEVVYGQISLKADYIRLNYTTNEVYAKGRYDSTAKKVIGRPIFKDGNDSYDTKEIRYNFKTKKGLIQGVITTQGEGNIRGVKVKKDSEDNLYIRGAIYTTCNLATPHFHINAPKLKVIKNKQVVSGPFNLVIAQVPLPLGLPFGFFPFPKQKEIGVSGIIVPQYGEEPNGRGYYLRDGGYYWAINEHIGMQFRGQIYTNGSWGLGVSSTYNKRYRYGGSLNLSFARNQAGEIIEELRTPRNDFSVQWSHSPVPRGRSSFSASVNVTSNSYNNFNARGLQDYTSNVAGSSIQYNRQLGTYARAGVSLRVNQQFGQTNPVTLIRENGKTDVGLDYNFGLNQLAPFALKGGSGQWYESFRLGLDFSGSAQISNTIQSRVDTSGLGFVINTAGTGIRLVNTTGNIRDSLARADSIRQGLILATGQSSLTQNLIAFSVDNLPLILRNAVVQNRYSIPIALPNVKLFRYINLTPGISLSGDIYTKKLNYRVLGDKSVRIDTIPGTFATYNVAFSASMNTRVYGTVFIRSKRIEAIRHTLAPSVTFSYTPDLSSRFFNQFQELDIPGLPETKRKVSRYRGLGGSSGGGLPRASSQVNFGLVNQLEMKVRSRGDSTGNEFTKIPIFDNLSLAGSYDLLAPEFALSTLQLSANTQILKNISLNFSSTFDPYALVPYISEPGAEVQYLRVNRFAVRERQGVVRMTNANFFLSTRFAPKAADKPKKVAGVPDEALKTINQNPELYVDFNIPWSVNLSYSFSINNYTPELSALVQTLQLTGDFSLTPKWKFTVQTGYDFTAMSPSLTTVGINRDLHCWEMAFNWTPFAGNRQRASNYSFDLRVRSAILQELKLSRRRSFYDRGGF